MKYPLLNIFIQLSVFILSGFLWLTQMPSMRQPTKLFVQIICVLSLIGLGLAVYSYTKMEKE